MRLLLPEDLPRVNSFDELRASETPAIWPCVEPETYKLRPYLSLGQSSWDYSPDDYFLLDTEYQANGWSLIKIKDVIVKKDLLVTNDGDVCAFVPWWKIGGMIDYFNAANTAEIIKRLKTAISDRPACEQVTVEEPCTYFHQASHGHWLFEALFPIAIWQKVGFLPMLLCDTPCPAYRKQFLDLLDYPQDKRFFFHTPTQDVLCKELWIAFPWRNRKSHLAPLNSGWTKDKKQCYDSQNNSWWFGVSSTILKMTHRLGAQASPQFARGDRIYIPRESAAFTRMCVNETAARDIALKHGFAVVDPGKLSAEEEAAIFYQAKIICGGSGGGLMNTVFCKPGARVICYGANDDIHWPLQSVCLVNQLDFVSFRSTQFSSMDRYYNGAFSPYVLDLIAFDELLSSLD